MTAAQRQAALYRFRERRAAGAGFPALHQTHKFVGDGVLPVTGLDTGAIFPDRERPITIVTSLIITANAGVHRGLIFEFGSSTRGLAAWVGDQTIGFTAGGMGDHAATALYDLAAELPVGREFLLWLSVNPGTGTVWIHDHGNLLAKGQAVNASFGVGGWSDGGLGSFASAKNGTVAPGVPVASDQAPAGFAMRSPLRAYLGQLSQGVF